VEASRRDLTHSCSPRGDWRCGLKLRTNYRPFPPSCRMTAPQMSSTPPLLPPIPISIIEPCSCCSLGEHDEVEWNPYDEFGTEIPVGMTMTPWVPPVTASRTPPAARFALTFHVPTTPFMTRVAHRPTVDFPSGAVQQALLTMMSE